MLGLIKQHSGGLPGFSFCLIYSRPGTEEVSNVETPISTDNKSSRKTCCLQSKAQERGSLVRQKTFRPLYYGHISQKKNCSSIPTNTRWMEYLGFHSVSCCNEDPPPIHLRKCGFRGGRSKSLNFRPLYPAAVPLEAIWKAFTSSLSGKNEGDIRGSLVENRDFCYQPGVMKLRCQ